MSCDSESESGDETVDDIESKAGDVTWDQDIQLRRMMKQSRRESLMSFKDDDIIFQNSSSAAQKKKSSNKSSNKASAEVSSKTKAVVLRGRFFEGGSGDSDDASSDSVDKVLYIKMALHSMTLDDLLWADDRPSSDNSSALRHCYHAVPSARLLLAILDGVDYIHSQGIVHRDLKPSNILLSVLEGKTCFVEGAVNISDCPTCGGERNLWVIPHIGDFGLVAEMREASPNLSKPTTSLQVYQPSTLAILSSQASRQAGTRFYYPPGKSDKTICPRLDVYSLGVIAFELTNSFGTRSERLVVLENLNRGIYPIGFDEHKMANGVKGMLYHERLKRWDCATLRRWLEDIIR
jgi:translation initiation factor 2-alpha kinase 3